MEIEVAAVNQGVICMHVAVSAPRFFLQGNQLKHKNARRSGPAKAEEQKYKNGSCPDPNLIQENKQGITQQSSNPQSQDYAREANSFMDRLPHLIPPATETRLKWPLMAW